MDSQLVDKEIIGLLKRSSIPDELKFLAEAVLNSSPLDSKNRILRALRAESKAVETLDLKYKLQQKALIESYKNKQKCVKNK